MTTPTALQRLGTGLLTPDSPSFAQATAVQFATDGAGPAAVVQPTTTAEVVEAVRAAREAQLPVAVRSGGHSYAAHGVGEGALAIDVRGLGDVVIDPGRLVGRAGGGATAGAYTAAAAEYGLATGFGDTPTVGIAGLTLGGGIGFLSRRDGLTVDNLLSAEVVLANGSVVTAAATQHPALFWALRGGGGNFGVVTELSYRLRATSLVSGGMLAFAPTPERIAAATAALLGAPDELAGMINLMLAPPAPFLPESIHGKPLMMLLVCWSGPESAAEAALAPLRAIGEPVVDAVATRPYPEMLQSPPGAGEAPRAVARTAFIDRVDEEWGARALAALSTAVTPVAAFNLRPMGGAIARSTQDTAFAHRHRAVMASVVAVTPDATVVPAAEAWVEETRDSVGLVGPGYVNFMSSATPDDVAAAYPGAVLERLGRVKRTYDPDNVFRINHNVLPSR